MYEKSLKWVDLWFIRGGEEWKVLGLGRMGWSWDRRVAKKKAIECEEGLKGRKKVLTKQIHLHYSRYTLANLLAVAETYSSVFCLHILWVLFS